MHVRRYLRTAASAVTRAGTEMFYITIIGLIGLKDNIEMFIEICRLIIEITKILRIM